VTAPAELRVQTEGTNVRVRVDGREAKAGEPVPLALREGEATPIEVVATNDVGTTKPVSFTVTLDTKPPGVAVTNPPADRRFARTEPVLLAGTCTDASGVAEVLVDDRPVKLVAAGGTGSWTADLGIVPAERTVEIVARDNAGNANEPVRFA